MPSGPHAWLLELFRNRPSLAPELLREALQLELPSFTEARIDSADLTDVQPAEYRADLVVVMFEGSSVLGVVVEVQLSRSCRSCWARPLSRKCPTKLRRVQILNWQCFRRWHTAKIAMRTNLRGLRSSPGPAVRDLDDDRSTMYFDLIDHSLSEDARRALQAMDPRKYEYQSEFARRYFSQGQTEGRAALVSRQLALRFGHLPQQVAERIAGASIKELDAMGERLLTAQTLEEAIGSRESPHE